MTTPDEIARQIIRAAQSGDSDINVMAYADVLLRRWREEIRQEEISHCARVWSGVELKKKLGIIFEKIKGISFTGWSI